MTSSVRPWRPLRLALVTETFPPEVNGVARTLGRWVDAFRARGHEVRVIRPRQAAEQPAPERIHGMPVPCYPQLRFGVAGPLRLRRLLGRYQPDLVHIATEGPLGWAALAATGILGLPVASSFHTNFDQYVGHYGVPGLEWLVMGYLRWFHNQTAVTLVPSEATRQRLLAEGIRNVAIWSRGVDAQAFHPRHRDAGLRGTIELGPDDVLLLYVGRLAPEKNLGALLGAFARLRQGLAVDAREHVRLALVGAGPSASHWQGLQLPGVLFPGEQYGAGLARWYASADVFAFPSCTETFGNVVLEAQASGLPVVGYDTTGVNERVTSGEDGLLVPMGGDLAEPLRRLCQDAALRQRLGTAGRARAERQDWDSIFDELEERYLELAGPERASPSTDGRGISSPKPMIGRSARTSGLGAARLGSEKS
jgi:glycosyltransferase involved in cell wall biosynthesis